MIELFEFIYDELTKVHGDVWHREEIPQDASYPFVSFFIPTDSPLEVHRSDIILELDVWHSRGATNNVLGEIESLTNEIEEHFKRMRYIDNEKLIIFERLSRIPIPDTNPDIRRRQLRYRLKVDWR